MGMIILGLEALYNASGPYSTAYYNNNIAYLWRPTFTRYICIVKGIVCDAHPVIDCVVYIYGAAIKYTLATLSIRVGVRHVLRVVVCMV